MNHAIERYAAADRSDPFTAARCYAHARQGLYGYEATPASERRSYKDANGNTRNYTVKVYREMKRP
jgi:hypothetical protein